MMRIIRLVLVGFFVFVGFVGCGTTRGFQKVPREKVAVPFENATSYILQGKILQDGKPFAGAQRVKNIPAKSKFEIWLLPDHKYIMEGEAWAHGELVGRFVKVFGTADYEMRGDSLAVAAPVVIRDIITGHLPALSAVIVNMCQDTAVSYVRVYNPQIPLEFVTLRGFNSYDFMGVVSGPVKWVQEYYDRTDRMILRAIHDDELDPYRRYGIFHGGCVVDIRRIVY